MAALLSLTAVAWADPPARLEAYRPQWQVGQKWMVETIVRQTSLGRPARAGEAPPRLRWQFEVRAVEPCGGAECYRLRITPLDRGEQGETTLWVDRRSMTLRKICLQVPTARGVQTLCETYRSRSDQPSPVFAPLTVPPVELPVFQSGTKGTAAFQYESFSGPAEAKQVGDVGFSATVEQSVATASVADYPSLLPADYAKNLENRPTVEVRLRTAGQQVRQVWQTGLPWPVFSDNGHAQSLLLPADAGQPATPGDR